MSNVLSVYWSPHHMRVSEDDSNSDLAYIRELQPEWIRIHQPTATAIYHAQRAAPNAKIMLRSWDIDDHNGDRKREMYADPKGAAVKHLALWNEKLIALKNELRVNGWNYDETKWYLGLVNEPDPAFVSQVVKYSLEAMRLASSVDLYLGVVVSSVGTFSKPSENPHGWALCKPLERPINDGGHILIAHEYWQPEGPNYGEDGGNLAWRHRHIPLDVPILIGESGANGYIYGRYSKDDDSGWQKTVKEPSVYAAQVKQYIEGCDSRVQGVCLYMTDYHSDQWQSFDTQPAMHQLLAIKDARPQVPSPFVRTVDTRLPQIEQPSPIEPPRKPTADGIIDPTVAQAILQVESGGRTHGDDGRIIIRFEAHIFRQQLANDALWTRHFRTDAARPWVDQMWRKSEGDPWRTLHTGKQSDEWDAFRFAAALAPGDAAYRSISMGAAQIMGFNHARIGYPTAQAMFEAFANAPMQTLGFINFCLSDDALFDAIQRRDWRTIAKLYNGSGAIDTYAPLLERAYNELGD